MCSISNSSEFCAALRLYLGNDVSEGYRPGDMAGGATRVREALPERAEVLIGEIEVLLARARDLRGLWGDGALPLDETCQQIDKFLASEYAFVPAPIRRKVVNALSYGLWK